MKNHFFKFVALVMVVATLFCIPVPVMASETEADIPANATRHTIEITVDPGEEVSDGNASDGVSPYIWGNPTFDNIGGGSTTYSGQFNIPDRYFAFESYALSSDGNTVPGRYTVGLVRSVIYPISSHTSDIDGTTTKNDWVTISNTSLSDYQFAITNHSATTITVYITYYSWT